MSQDRAYIRLSFFCLSAILNYGLAEVQLRSAEFGMKNKLVVSPATAAEVADALHRTGLLRPVQFAKLQTEILPAISEDPQELAFALVHRGWLTSYQAEMALQGRVPELVIGGYQILSPIGSGGMGQVFKAWQKRLNRFVALKIIKDEILRSNPRAQRRFKREAMAVARLSHPNIVAICDADEDRGLQFIVLEYVDGPDLERLVRERGPLPWEMVCDFARQTALGLQHAHEAGFVHRDIKPSNLLVALADTASRPSGGGRLPANSGSTFGTIKILDMGLARTDEVIDTQPSMTREGAVMGTPDFIAPEQALDASSVDIRADLYSLGGTMYYLLMGRVPFPGGTVMEKLMKHQRMDPDPIEQARPDVPARLVQVIRKLMSKSPSDRFQTPLELIESLEKLPQAINEAAAPATRVDSVAPWIPWATPAESPTAEPALSPEEQGSTVCDSKEVVTVVTAPSLCGRGNAAHDTEIDEMAVPAQKVAMLRGHTGAVTALCFSGDGTVLVTGGVDSVLQVWAMTSPPSNLAVLQEPNLAEVQVVAMAPGGNSIVAGSAALDSCLVKWNWREPPSRGRVTFDCSTFSEAMAFAPDGSLLASAVGPSVAIWDCGDGPPRRRTSLKGFTDDVKAVGFSHDGRWLVCGDAGGCIQLWKLGWMGPRQSAAFPAHRGGITSFACSADGKWLASAGVDRIVRVWSLASPNPQPKAVLRGLKGVGRQILFLPESNLLLTACDGGRVTLWDWTVGSCQHVWRLEQPIICSLAVSPDGSWVAAGGSDGTATIYDLVPETT
ncbi:MAG: serine/threonine protein kinase [Gemmataceae bacterium]|nr:serine/threonine protein kinase [Gemmataceae bacterium]